MDRCRSLRLIFVGICLFSIFPSDECKKVEEGYKFAVYRTRACPRNKTEWEKRESAFNCSKESSSYTCLPNENITELLEFCYPLQVLASHEDICLFLAKKNSDVDSYDCTHFDHGCPTGFYTGATMYKYQSCLSIGKGCFLAEPSCERATQHREPENPHGTSGSETIWIPILVGALVLFAIFVLAIVKYKRSNFNQQTNDEENPETHQLLLQTDKENDREGSNFNQQTNDEENPETHQLLLQIDKENDLEACPTGYYGVHCTPCSHCRGSGVCNTVTGYCRQGCKPHWQMPQCQECENGYYNAICGAKCGHCLYNAACNKDNGYCEQGCEGNYMYPFCKECVDHFYGDSCSSPCGNCLNGKACDKHNGSCSNGCKPHFKGLKCDECEDGFYDSDCSSTCGRCLNGEYCDKITGHCPRGCQFHFLPPICLGTTHSRELTAIQCVTRGPYL
uniref:Uncharacterized protein LOC111113661 n=1 Tax=Crassostrea virginica TaxID=6565 RepID=A0A8B8BXT8_CRAVI|nr:uncharacterized protein LOC111113661 [Crassostrea virginica]